MDDTVVFARLGHHGRKARGDIRPRDEVGAGLHAPCGPAFAPEPEGLRGSQVFYPAGLVNPDARRGCGGPGIGANAELHHIENAVPVEIGGRTGPEPTRYGDWEKDGRCIDF